MSSVVFYLALNEQECLCVLYLWKSVLTWDQWRDEYLRYNAIAQNGASLVAQRVANLGVK